MVYLCHRILCHLKKRIRALLIALEIQWGIIEGEEKQDAEKFQLYYPIFINQSKKKSIYAYLSVYVWNLMSVYKHGEA